MVCLAITVVYIILIALLLAAFVSATYGHEVPKPVSKPGFREHYGPPPGVYRALTPEELGDRGWISWPFDYHGNTASAVSHMIERSA